MLKILKKDCLPMNLLKKNIKYDVDMNKKSDSVFIFPSLSAYDELRFKTNFKF